MRFLLINPSRVLTRTNIWSVVKSATPPIGLAILAAVLEKSGHRAHIIDAQALQLTPEDVTARATAAGSFDIIGLTATTPEINSAAETARLLREAFPKARILFGGVHPTIFHRELVESGVADLVIRGEGEIPIVALAGSSKPEDIPNLTWKNDSGEVIVNAVTADMVDLDQLPLPAYGKLPIKHYRSALGAAKQSPSIGIITSRGCPGACTFCYSGMFGKKIRHNSAVKVLEHIRFLIDAYGIKEISFYDDTFTSDRQRVVAICNSLIKERIGLSWSCFARVDTIDQELLHLMRKAGCHQIMYGFETGDDSVLKTINKRVTSSNYHETVRITRTAGIDVRGAFMLGNPGETEQSLQSTIRLATALGIQYAIFNITTPYPGTALYSWADKTGYLLHRDWEKYDYAHPVMALPALAPRAIHNHYRRAYRAFYLRPEYILRSLPGLLSPGRLKILLHAFLGIVSFLCRKH